GLSPEIREYYVLDENNGKDVTNAPNLTRNHHYLIVIVFGFVDQFIPLMNCDITEPLIHSVMDKFLELQDEGFDVSYVYRNSVVVSADDSSQVYFVGLDNNS